MAGAVFDRNLLTGSGTLEASGGVVVASGGVVVDSGGVVVATSEESIGED